MNAKTTEINNLILCNTDVDHSNHQASEEQHDSETRDKDVEELAFECVLVELGMPGRFLITQICLVLLCNFRAIFMINRLVFMGYVPPFRCETVDATQLLTSLGLQNDSTAYLSYGECEIDVFTNYTGSLEKIKSMSCPYGRNFSGGKYTSIITEWDLVCESNGMGELIGSFFFFGSAVGGVIFSHIAERYGRKITYTSVSLGSFVIELMVLCVTNIHLIGILSIFNGIFMSAALCISHVSAMEISTPKQRVILGIVLNMSWVLFSIIYVGFAFGLQDYGWRALQIASVASNSTFPLLLLFFFESPRWLVIKGRSDEALKVIRHACKQNKKCFAIIRKTFMDYVEKVEQRIKHDISSPNTVSSSKAVICWQFLKHKRNILNACIMGFVWLSCDLSFYGMFMMSSALDGNRFLNFFLLCATEIPSVIVCLILLLRMKRRTLLQSFFAMASVCFLAYALMTTLAEDVTTYKPVKMAFFLFGKFSISAAFLVVTVWTPEIFPTQFRTFGYGLCQFFGKVGTIMSPYIRPFQVAIPWGPTVCFSVISGISFIVVIFLPEMKDANLLDTSQDVVDLAKKKRPKVISTTNDTCNL